MTTLLFSLVALGFLQVSAGLSPVPDDIRYGFPYKQNTDCKAPVEIDLFVDLTCPDSKAAFPVVKQAVDRYGSSKVLLRTYMFPLPYHRASYLACRGTFAINSFNPQLTYDWMQTVFDKQAFLYNYATANIGDDRIEQILGRWSADLFRLSSDEFLKKSQAKDWDQRLEWKYGCSRGVYGTPIAFVNGADVGVQTNWTLENWVMIIEPLLKATKSGATDTNPEVVSNP